jgi:hypothetical protein
MVSLVREGHNLNLAHSGEGLNNDYSDQSGLMVSVAFP